MSTAPYAPRGRRLSWSVEKGEAQQRRRILFARARVLRGRAPELAELETKNSKPIVEAERSGAWVLAVRRCLERMEDTTWTFTAGKKWRRHSGRFATIRLRSREEIPEDRYSFRATPETRTIGQLLTHIALITNVPMHIHGNKINDLKQVNFPQLMKEAGTLEMMPRSKADIIMLLKSERDKFAAFLEGTTNGFLAEGVATPNPDRPRAAASRCCSRRKSTRCTTVRS